MVRVLLGSLLLAARSSFSLAAKPLLLISPV